MQVYKEQTRTLPLFSPANASATVSSNHLQGPHHELWQLVVEALQINDWKCLVSAPAEV